VLAEADQAIVDRLFDRANLQVEAGVMVSRLWPFEAMVMAVLLEHEKRIEHLMRHLERRVPSAESWHREEKRTPQARRPRARVSWTPFYQGYIATRQSYYR
jgi:hypothetical protein